MCMSAIKVLVDEEVAEEFRRTAMKVFGYRKGSLSKAAQEAFQKWVQGYAAMVRDVQIPEEPIEAIAGQLEGVRLPSVELQHEARKIRGRYPRSQ